MAAYDKPPPQHQIFINYLGDDDVRGGFVDQLDKALKSDGVNVNADGLTGGIEDASIALVIFSSGYTGSRLCLDELVKIKERMEEGKLRVIPIFYKLDSSAAKGLEEGSGLDLLDPAMSDFEPRLVQIWKEALDCVSCMMGYQLHKNSDESKFIPRIVKDVKTLLTQISMEEQINKLNDRLSEQQKVASLDTEKVNSESDATSAVTPKEVENVQGEAELFGKSISDDDFLGDIQSSVEEKRVSKSSTLVTDKDPSEHKVLVNFQRTDLRDGFVTHLVEALESVGFNVYIDEDDCPPEVFSKRIEESRIALVIFSSSYTESTYCLDKLVKIKEHMDEGKLLTIPIFYKVKQSQVTQLEGNFGIRIWNFWRSRREYRVIKWKEALEYVGGLQGFIFYENSLESELMRAIVKEVEVIKKMIEIPLPGPQKPSSFPCTGREVNTELPTREGENPETDLTKEKLFGIKLRMEQLEQKLEFDYDETRIIGVVGMPGIGKTTLAMCLYEEWNSNFVHCMPLLGIRKKSKDHELAWLRKTLLEVLLEGKFPEKKNEITHESVKDILLQTKVFVVLSDVSDKKQLDFLLGNLDWVKKGSKIVITTCDKSLLKGFVDDIYVVPLLNDEEAFHLFSSHAFDRQTYSPSQNLVILSRKFVGYARGHPQALISLGTELRGKDEAYWKQRLETVTYHDNTTIQDVWKFSTDQLNERQKDVFLDIVHFFISEDEYFVRSLLDSGDPDATDAVSEVRDLADKFLITISNGRVEMNDLLYRFGKGLGSPWLRGMWKCKDMHKLMNGTEPKDVRGIFLDMSEVTNNIVLDRMTFTNMCNLRYLKIYDSSCSQQCKADCKLYFPDGLEFPLEEIRYLYWVKFPLEELPPDFRPENLVDLGLPYSQIERIWKGFKDTPRLKWVDLRHSIKLFDLSALSEAVNLQRLNLEGCTVLEELPAEIQNMKSLAFLNLRGCTRLWSLPKINLISLKTLILSDCSNLKDFQLTSENVEFLHLDGTAITGLPFAIQSLQRLVVLNLKNCIMLECLPNCLGELKALEELILSGCSRLKNLSDIRESMKHLQSLLLDRIGAIDMSSITISKGQASADMSVQGPSGWPKGVNGVSSLRRLSLSGNDFVSLETEIWKLYNLNWFDLKDCKMLESIPMLPPRLQYFDAHGCDSLERVANPLAIPVLTHQNHATFNFSNCTKLDEDAKENIISYTTWRSQLVLDALSRHNGDSVLEALTGTCFPGWEVPAWFSHRAFGSVLQSKLPLRWSDNKFIGIALCAVILFPDYHKQRDRLLVKCNCVFYNKDGSRIRFSCTVGSWSKASNTPLKHESSHIFIGYTTMLDNYRHGVEDNEEGCSLTEASIEFQVTDGTEVLGSCKVLNSGFRLIYASDEIENTCWDPVTAVISERIENVSGEAKSQENSRIHDEIQSESYYDPALEGSENFASETKSDAKPGLRKSLENKIVDISNVENDAGEEITVSSDLDSTSSGDEMRYVGVELRLKQMEKVLYSMPGKTIIVGVVGMPGIGKTTLAKLLFEKRGSKFPSHLFLTVSKECRPERLQSMFVKKLLEHQNRNISDETTQECVKAELLQTKIFAVLDDVTDKKQLQFLLGKLAWVKKGSKIVITTRDKSLLEGFGHNITTYFVPPLKNREAVQLFTYHAFYKQMCPSETFLSLSRMFVEHSTGNPLVLESLGSLLCGKDEAYWQHELQKARQSFNSKMGGAWRFSIDQLSEGQKDVFLDIVYFFRSEEEYFVRSLLDSENPEAMSEVRDLADKLLITISGGRVEMHDQLYALSKDLGSPERRKLWNYKDIVGYMKKRKQSGTNDVRGIFLDMSEATKNIALGRMTFTNMCNLRYLKIYDSSGPQQCKADCKLYFPDGLEFPLEEIRYLHWVKFPLEELPPDFRPENLVDLRLPYSKIERISKGVKDTPRLKRVDLRHSIKLFDLSALSKAVNLQRLNLEGCTGLEEFPVEIHNMKSLVFLNLRGCTRLWSLPKINLISLKTLILSDCSNLKNFQLISESVEFLHLDGTAITGLPLAIKSLQRLVVLNLKNCKMLECLPNSLGELKALEELILSGCSRLKNLSDIRESMKHLQLLLIDEIGALEMPSITITKGQASADMLVQGPSGWPKGVNEVSSLRRLSLSGNYFVSLQTDIWKLYNLSWLDVKDCKMLRSIPMLPPRLEYFDAHGCDSLERVENPLALPVVLEQIHATFNFSNCSKLDLDAKDSIVSYTRWKSELVLNALSRYNEDSVLEDFTGTCFPGWEVPARFRHQASGSELKAKLPPHWSDNKFNGIALCAVIRFPDYHEQRARLVVKCNCVFNNKDGSHIRFSCIVGSWSDPSKTPGKIVPSHVFIGYACMLDIKKRGEEEYGEGCSHTKTYFEFQVTDGTEVLHGYEVMKCGFSLVYASDELRVQSGVHGSHVEANRHGDHSKNVAIASVRRETEKVERRLDGGHDIVESPNKMIAIAKSSQPPNTKSPEYETRLNNLRRETHGKPRVFISCHGSDLCIPFVKHLVSTLRNDGVNVLIDNDERMWTKMLQLYNRIEDSKIAVVIFSKRYLASGLCLNELVKMDELAKEGKLLVIPVFYEVISNDMKNLKGEFGRCFKEMRKRHEEEPKNIQKWETSLMSMTKTTGIHSEIHGIDAPLVEATVKAVQRELTKTAGGKFRSLGRGFMASRRVFIYALFAAFLFSLFKFLYFSLMQNLQPFKFLYFSLMQNLQPCGMFLVGFVLVGLVLWSVIKVFTAGKTRYACKL